MLAYKTSTRYSSSSHGSAALMGIECGRTRSSGGGRQNSKTTSTDNLLAASPTPSAFRAGAPDAQSCLVHRKVNVVIVPSYTPITTKLFLHMRSKVLSTPGIRFKGVLNRIDERLHAWVVRIGLLSRDKLFM